MMYNMKLLCECDVQLKLFQKHIDLNVVWNTPFYFLIIHLIMLKLLKEYYYTVLCFMLFWKSAL
jgi:hypothetical protein